MASRPLFFDRTATWMSGILLALLSLSAKSAAGVETTATAADDLDARHSLGFQVGGSAFVQMVYRLRLLGHSYLELGVGGAPEGALNGSAGLLVAHSTGTRVFPYAAAGVGFGVEAGPIAATNAAGVSCGLDTPGCPSSSRSLHFFYVRAGVGVVLDAARHISLGLDLGSWIGETSRRSDDGRGVQTSSSRKIVWPMAGLACFYSF